MNYYFAPMEGITTYQYRNAYQEHFGCIDKYFTPFLAPNQNHRFSSREINDILPENNQGLYVVPQILTNHADYFIWAALEMKAYGYQEVNLNLGCPARTVVTKGRGSGFLARQEELNQFLDRIFSRLDMKISIKTRIGKQDPDECYELMEIFNCYPMEELIIHPRIQTDFYKNKPNLAVFRDALSMSRHPVCYNGDLFTADAFTSFATSFPQVDTVMLGRGLIGNPGLAGEIRHEIPLDKKVLRRFHDSVCRRYQETYSGDRNTLFKMKEIWFYMNHIFTEHEKYMKKIRKTEKFSEYEAIVASLFRDQDIIAGAGYPGM